MAITGKTSKKEIERLLSYWKLNDDKKVNPKKRIKYTVKVTYPTSKKARKDWRGK